MKLSRISFLFLLLFLFVPSVVLAQNSTSVQTESFSKAECISRLTKEVDAPYRLSLVKATVRCNAIEKRINLLSKQILGKWQSRSEGRTVTLEFFADGTAKRYFGSGSNMEKWAIVNPYGTLGEESLQFDDSYLSAIKFSGSMMIITSQPASATIVERWERIPVAPRGQAGTSAQNGNWDEFWNAFRTAVQKRDRVALKAMMPSTLEYCSDNVPPSKAIQYLDGSKGQGWQLLNRAIAGGTAPYRRPGLRVQARVAPSNGGSDSYGGWWAVFELRNGRWLWTSFVCAGE